MARRRRESVARDFLREAETRFTACTLPPRHGMRIAYRLKGGRVFYVGTWDANRRAVLSARGIIESRERLMAWVALPEPRRPTLRVLKGGKEAEG